MCCMHPIHPGDWTGLLRGHRLSLSNDPAGVLLHCERDASSWNIYHSPSGDAMTSVSCRRPICIFSRFSSGTWGPRNPKELAQWENQGTQSCERAWGVWHQQRGAQTQPEGQTIKSNTWHASWNLLKPPKKNHSNFCHWPVSSDSMPPAGPAPVKRVASKLPLWWRAVSPWPKAESPAVPIFGGWGGERGLSMVYPVAKWHSKSWFLSR